MSQSLSDLEITVIHLAGSRREKRIGATGPFAAIKKLLRRFSIAREQTRMADPKLEAIRQICLELRDGRGKIDETVLQNFYDRGFDVEKLDLVCLAFSTLMSAPMRSAPTSVPDFEREDTSVSSQAYVDGRGTFGSFGRPTPLMRRDVCTFC